MSSGALIGGPETAIERVTVARTGGDAVVARDEFGPFLAAVRGAYAAARDADPELTADLDVWLAALDGLSGARVPVDPEDQPVCRHLAAALDLAEAGPAATVAAAARPFAASLGWRHWYRVDHKLPDFSQSYAHTEIVGPSAPVSSQDMRCGFILMAPHTLYPTHAHSAVELYLVLGGTAEWQRGAEPWARRPPGAFILHPSRIGHAMRTTEEPLLALFAWHGVLESDLVMPLDDL
jgi:mannose-6-phosphate isomerase-like protein (cupin superfamily)